MAKSPLREGEFPGIPEAFRRTSIWTTLGLVRAELGPLYLYYGESGDRVLLILPATLETGAPAGRGLHL